LREVRRAARRQAVPASRRIDSGRAGSSVKQILSDYLILAKLLKDANLALAAGEAVGVPLPSCNVWRDRLVGAVAHGDGGREWPD
jgi:3-hydroxyisobutyrate dehydrogenase-like beta-hydroxyacid dehydrogenase